MMANQDSDTANHTRFGLSFWMERVLDEVDGARRNLDADRVHDLRVALRRCRSMAEGFIAIDRDKGWRFLFKEGRTLFKRLGRLRDVQVLEEWLGRLGEPEDPVSVAMLLHLGQTERELKREAVAALHTFNSAKWHRWIGQLQARARRMPMGGAAFQLSALQFWNEAYELHKHALRNRSAAAYHRLRIGIKKFRYTVENFLPLVHNEWGRDLKEIQDCLGETHDLFVFWQTSLRLRAFPDLESKERWRALIARETTKRIDCYKAKMVGRHSLWRVWRQGLPPQDRLPSMSLRRMETWASYHGINLVRARRVRRLALQLFNGLRRGNGPDIKRRRSILHCAAILQELGRGKNGKDNHQGLPPGLPASPGFTAESLSVAAMVIRGQLGGLQGSGGADYSAPSEEQRRLVMELCSILRLARVLSSDSKRTIRILEVEPSDNSIVILASGYSAWGPLAEKVARARHLLECAWERPVIIKGVAGNRDTEQGQPALVQVGLQ